MPVKLVLASQSPRRQQLLQQLGVSFACCPASVDETPLPGEAVAQYALRLAEEKAKAGYQAWALQQPPLPALGSDTCGWLDGEILGKPRDEADAKAMLARMSGRSHQIFTAIALFDGHQCFTDLVVSTVHFAHLSPELIDAYWRSGEPADKAGAYGIQGLGGALVDRIEGSYSAIVGLPLAQCRQLLAQVGLEIWQEPVHEL